MRESARTGFGHGRPVLLQDQDRVALAPSLSRRKKGWSYPTFVIAHFACCAPSACPVSTICWLGCGWAPPR